MDVQIIVDKVKLLQPTVDEIQQSYSGIDLVGANAIQNTYHLTYAKKEMNYANVIEELVDCSNVYELIWAGIQFNNKYQVVPKHIAPGYEFAAFNDCVLAVDIPTNEVLYIDFYEANQDYIVFRCATNPDKFISALLYLLEIDLDFQFRSKLVNGYMLDKLVHLSGGNSYKAFYEFLFQSYKKAN